MSLGNPFLSAPQGIYLLINVNILFNDIFKPGMLIKIYTFD